MLGIFALDLYKAFDCIEREFLYNIFGGTILVGF